MNRDRLPKIVAAFFACAITVALFHSVAMLAVQPQPAGETLAARPASPQVEPAPAHQRMHVALASLLGHRAVSVH